MRTYNKKYQLNTKISSWVIKDWDSQKGTYSLQCACGIISNGPASFVDKKINQLKVFGYSGCKMCFNAHKKQLIPHEVKLKRVYEKYIKSAKTRNIPFNLTPERCVELFNSNCNYCGDSPENVETSCKVKYQGIDRIDNNLGYIEGNVIPCCSFCNYAKHIHTQEYFLSKISKIHNNVQRLAEKRTQKSGEMVGTPLSIEKGDDIVWTV